MVSSQVRKAPEIYFVGNNISGTYLRELTDVLEGKDFSVNVISKSGTTTEPAIAFRVFRKMLVEKYGREGAAKRIYATTDRAKGALKKVRMRKALPPLWYRTMWAAGSLCSLPWACCP